MRDIRVAKSALARNYLVDNSGACEGIDWTDSGNEHFEYVKTLGSSMSIYAFTAALASIGAGLNMVIGAVFAMTHRKVAEVSPRSDVSMR